MVALPNMVQARPSYPAKLVKMLPERARRSQVFGKSAGKRPAKAEAPLVESRYSKKSPAIAGVARVAAKGLPRSRATRAIRPALAQTSERTSELRQTLISKSPVIGL